MFRFAVVLERTVWSFERSLFISISIDNWSHCWKGRSMFIIWYKQLKLS